MTPSWLDLVILSLGIFRVVRFVGWDDLSARLRAWISVSDEVYDGWIELQHVAEQRGEPFDEFLASVGEHGPTGFRWWLARLIRCPWCLGVWITLPIWGAWLAWPDGTVGVLVPLAIMSLVGLIAKNLDP